MHSHMFYAAESEVTIYFSYIFSYIRAIRKNRIKDFFLNLALHLAVSWLKILSYELLT